MTFAVCTKVPGNEMNNPLGKTLFKVAIVSDTHVNEKEDFSASPYPANAEANPRARHVFSQVNQIDPVLTIHLGDMVNPVPELGSYGPAADNFHAIAANLKAPIHLVPGNHDIGDKPVKWMPAGMVNAEFIALYRKHFGKDYYAVTHQGCHFVVVNAPLMNSGDPAEAEQAEWLEEYLASHSGERVFVFSHYPPYISDPAEPGSYDNIEEPARSWFLDLIRTHKPEALFCAHVHNFWYDRIGDTEYYITPSTCFVRHDYSEMYRINGGDQKGRNDAAKLGFLTLELRENGHIAHYHRTYGATLAEGAGMAPPVAPRPHVKASGLAGVFVDMRHAWAEELAVAPSGAVDEFRRKRARNDYPVMALWEMGLQGLRVPIQDLCDPRVRRRMELMSRLGHRFQVYLYGMPDAAEREALADHAALVDRLELVLNWEEIVDLISEIEALKADTGLQIVLSRVNRKDGAKHIGSRFNHLISHGFTLAEMDELQAFMTRHPDLIDCAQFTIPRSASPWQSARRLATFAKDTRTAPVLYVKSTEASPAEIYEDEVANAQRFAEAAMAAIGFGLDVVLDTMDDADRGYFTRTGLVDRRFNPRLAGELLSVLALETSRGVWSAASSDEAALERDGQTLRIVPANEAGQGGWICPRSGQCGDVGDTPDTALVIQIR
ncbi:MULTISPECIES: metallophosphoesterase family protein [unclassified Roseovarius]|uniref:metallophosphoesterase family protein n=1 Tax=unclassified Roseovarius TaxID=2614913 RepID=UPI00273E4C48|nr:metallophosphoesterase [Roseovarius sp. MMSF_3350]